MNTAVFSTVSDDIVENPETFTISFTVSDDPAVISPIDEVDITVLDDGDCKCHTT